MAVQIREAEPADAEQLVAYMQRIAAEPKLTMPLGPGEFTNTVEDERAFIQRCMETDNFLFLVAVDDDEIVGQLTCQGGTRTAERHVVTLGITVRRDRRNTGVGSSLITRAVEWAQSTEEVRRIQLYVFANNERAIHVYEKLGFEIEGRRQRAVYKDGEYVDDLIMALLL